VICAKRELNHADLLLMQRQDSRACIAEEAAGAPNRPTDCPGLRNDCF